MMKSIADILDDSGSESETEKIVFMVVAGVTIVGVIVAISVISKRILDRMSGKNSKKFVYP